MNKYLGSVPIALGYKSARYILGKGSFKERLENFQFEVKFCRDKNKEVTKHLEECLGHTLYGLRVWNDLLNKKRKH